MREDDVFVNIVESFENGEFDLMDQSTIRHRQEEALQAYDRLENTQWAMLALQAAMQAEQALQLVAQNHWLEQIARTLRSMDETSQAN